MTHRPILTARQRNDLMALPTDEGSMLSYYILSDEDIIRIKTKARESQSSWFCHSIMRFTLSRAIPHSRGYLTQ